MKKLLILLFFIFPLHAEILSSEDLMYSPDQSQVMVSPSGRWISFLEAQEDKTKTLNIIDMKTMKMYYAVRLNEKDNFYNSKDRLVAIANANPTLKTYLLEKAGWEAGDFVVQ